MNVPNYSLNCQLPLSTARKTAQTLFREEIAKGLRRRLRRIARLKASKISSFMQLIESMVTDFSAAKDQILFEQQEKKDNEEKEFRKERSKRYLEAFYKREQIQPQPYETIIIKIDL